MNIIDLFSGCGGFSTGFGRVGYHASIAVEVDLWASETYAANHPSTPVLTEDIRRIRPTELALSTIDGVIGGPPCQGFSLSGSRDPKDPRNSLFMEFSRFVRELQPRFFVMENVTGILSMRTREHRLVTDILHEEFTRAGYRVAPVTLNAAEFGVPQSRQRVFFIGLRADLPFNPAVLIPKPILLPSQQIGLWDAISDLPQIASGEGGEIQQYSDEPHNEYQRMLRKNSSEIYNHVAMRHTARLIERFGQISFGQSVKDVPQEHGQRSRGEADKISGKVFSQNNMRPYADRPCPTVAASFQSNFIHPYLDRNFTAREGARIQSFPDHYIFKGKRTTMSWEKHLSQYQQIGNAVPPLLAEAIASSIKSYLGSVDKIPEAPLFPQRQLVLSI